MTTQTIRPEREHLLIGCAVVAAAALTSLHAAPGPVVLLSLLAVLRVCWLEDNIINDLIGRDRLPGGYVNTAIRRGNWRRQWLGREPAEDAAAMRPHQVATAMRAEIQVWACMVLGMGSTLVAKAGPFTPVLNLALGAVLFVMALRRIDRLMVSLAHCAVGRALPRRLLSPSRGHQNLGERD